MWLHTEVRTLGDIPRYWAATKPEKAALVDNNGEVSFSQLNERAARLANSLVSSGLKAGGNVGFLGKNSSQYFEILFGVNKAGCAVMPLNWRLAAPELAAIVEDAEASLIFVDKEFAETAASIQEKSSQSFRIIELDSVSPGKSEYDRLLAEADSGEPDVRIDLWQAAVLCYTSGTTGKPKGVQLTHQGLNYMRLCEHLEPALRWKEDDVMLTVMPVFHLVGTGLSLQSLYNGSTVSVLPMLDPGQLLAFIARDRPTVCALVPTAIQMVLDHPDAASADFSSLRLVMYAGSSINAVLLQRAIREMKCDFMQFYGATETSGAATLLRPEQHVADDEARLKSCGSPLPLIEIKVVDSAGNELPDGEIGEFLIRSPAMTTGYYKQPDTTAAAFVDGWYRSGDAGYRDENGLYYLVDRVKDMIVTGGENVYSTEVEQVLQTHPRIRMCAAIGLPDEKWGERVVAVAVSDEDGSRPSAEELIAHCREHIAGYKVPKQVEFVDSLPMTPTGKVLKRALRAQFTQ